MEWVETTGKDLEEATERALSLLGVAEQDADIVILSDAKRSLFSRLKSEARVQARVKPRSARKRPSRNRRRPPSKSNSRPNARPGNTARPSNARNDKTSNTGATLNNEKISANGGATNREELPVEELEEVAVSFLKGLLEAAEIDAEVLTETSGEALEIRIVGNDLGVLIGSQGSVMMSVFHLLKVVVQSHADGRRYPKIRLDIGDYRAKRREALGKFAVQVANDVKEKSEEIALEPMNAADRKVVHEAVQDVSGVATKSEGEDPNRRVVIIPENEAD